MIFFVCYSCNNLTEVYSEQLVSKSIDTTDYRSRGNITPLSPRLAYIGSPLDEY